MNADLEAHVADTIADLEADREREHRGATNPAFGWLLAVTLGVVSGAAGALLVWAISSAVQP